MITAIALLLALLLTAHHAEAECAWVLWRETTYLMTGYTPMLGTTSEKECGKRKGEYDRLPRPETIDKNAGLRYVCLPDTIDPRGAKGGGR